ncbi:hypothetical protein DM01DRAFT_1297754 [Hesseltinella vesiculosa]|uniref:Camp independent regulatory protein n=1 Tax=Hesseltinella vesiculosa TaxID=101127 RepID=A0A1X2GXR5_9FUNG|nr:hypothetical protein DM01DRAFT_1297754 [Hesseltinella vesiculosa]
MLVTESFHGFIETTQDVLLIFEGCRRGLLPRICRRLQERERKTIRSGSVFVFDQRESGIKRWTDGRVWSPSRILGNFLIYRELDKRDPGEKKTALLTPMEDRRLSYSSIDTAGPVDRNRERQLVGSLSDTYKFRPDGLIKKTMSIVVNGVSQHLISYYDPRDVLENKLRTPSSVPELASLEISPELLVKQNFRIPPMIEPTFDQHSSSSSDGPLSPDSLADPYGDRRMHHPLRSMSLGSVRSDHTSQGFYIKPEQTPTSSTSSTYPYVQAHPFNNMYSPSTYSPAAVAAMSVQMPGLNPSSPTSLTSPTHTPMMPHSPHRTSFQPQRHFSTSAASPSQPRYDPRHYSSDYTPNPPSPGLHPSDMMDPTPTHQPNPPTSSSSHLGQLLNPVHPLQNDQVMSSTPLDYAYPQPTTPTPTTSSPGGSGYLPVRYGMNNHHSVEQNVYGHDQLSHPF